MFGTLRAATMNPALRIYFIVLVTVMLGFGASKDLDSGKSLGFVIFSTIFQLLLWCGLTAVGLMVVSALGLFIGRGKGVIGEHELIITDDGIIEKTEYNESLHKWKGLGALKETAGYYFLRVSETGGGYHLIPRTTNILEGDPEEFVRELRLRFQSIKK